MTDNAVGLILAGCAGVLLGIWFFGGLWLTVRRLPRTAPVPLLFLGSFLIRTVVTLAGFALVMAGHRDRAAACLIGFVIARIGITCGLKPAAGESTGRTAA